jgi:hypothetical protein
MKFALTFFLTLGVLSAAPAITTNVNLLGSTTLSVGGVNETVMSIDFDDWSDVGSSWKAYLSNVGGKITKTYHPADAKVYKEEAYLYTQITKPEISSQTVSELQMAAWYLTDNDYIPSLKTYLKTNKDRDPFTRETYANIAADLKSAEDGIAGMDFSTFFIVSDISHSGRDRNAEYILATPEPATNALLGMSLALAGFGRFLFRRKQIERA